MLVVDPPAQSTSPSGSSAVPSRASPRELERVRVRLCGDYWGARIRTWDRGTKTRCLTAWLRPMERRNLFGSFSKEEDQRCNREKRDHADCDRPHHRQRDRHAENEQLRRGEDPPRLAQRVRTVAARDVPPEPDGDDGECDRSPPMERVEEVEQALDRGDPEREPEAPLPEPAPAA